MLDTSRSVRKGGHPVEVFNSGLEVWLYDNTNLEAIRRDAEEGCGGMPGNFEALTRDGLVVGYDLLQDDSVVVEVHVGAPFTAAELSAGRWLAPQTALLRLPSGTLCIESNDASRIGPGDPTEEGARVKVAPGDYRLTLYRVDHEALEREGIEWEGPQELVLLTPGGSAADAATGLLPFEASRDLDWVGQYTIKGKRAEALVWLGDYWDTFIVNLDSAAVKKLGLKPGAYIRTRVPDAGLVMTSVFADSWDDAQRLPPPAGASLEEYGWAALCDMADWNGQQAFFCRREMAKTKVQEKHQTQWLRAVVEVLDAKPQPVVKAGERMRRIDLRTKPFVDSGMLAFVLSDVVPGAEGLDELDLAGAVDLLDRALARSKFSAAGDVAWDQGREPRSMEMWARLYTGAPDMFAAAVVTEGSFEIVFLSEANDGNWVVTGVADVIETLASRRGPNGVAVPNPRVRVENMDEPLAAILKAHRASIAKAAPAPAPAGFDDAVAALERFISVAFS